MKIERFKRKFVALRDDVTELDLDLEICVDSQDRLFVRHYTLFLFYGWSLEELDFAPQEKIDNHLSNISSKCRSLYGKSIKWLGYKLDCTQVLLFDEAENLEIETLAILLPFNLFVDLIEYTWNSSQIPKAIAKHPEKVWYQNKTLLIKIAKWLSDNQMSLSDLTVNLTTRKPERISDRYYMRTND